MEEQPKRGMFSVHHLPLRDLIILQERIAFSTQGPAPGYLLKHATVWLSLSNTSAQELPPKPQPVAEVIALARVKEKLGRL